MTPANRAQRVIRAWARVYTAALPPDVRIRRHDELLSDVWEHQALGASDWAVVRRALAGVPADLRWRWEQGVFPRRLRLGGRLGLTGVLLLLLAVFDHDIVGAETAIGTSMYILWFVCAATAIAATCAGAWRRFRS